MLKIPKKNLLNKQAIEEASAYLHNGRLAPLRRLQTVYGMFPAKLTSDFKYKLSIWQALYVCVWVIAAASARIYLEPALVNPTFFMTVHRIRNILLPIACLTNLVFIAFYSKQFLKIYSDIYVLGQYMSLRHLQQGYYLQIIGIFVGYGFYIGENIMAYFSRPNMFVGIKIVIKSLEFLMDTAMLIVKLQFFMSLFFLRNLLCRVRSDLLQNNYSNVNFLTYLYEKAISLSECINQCYGVTLGVFALMTAMNCISAAYFYFAHTEADAEYLLVFWIIIDLTLMWLVITSAVIFTHEVWIYYHI